MTSNNESPSLLNELPEPELMKQFAGNQAKELEIRLIEAQTAQANSERQFLYATKQLEAQERDRKDERVYKETLEKKSFYLFVTLIIAIVVFLTAAVLKDKDQMIIEIIKAVVYCGTSGAGAYALGRYRNTTQNQENRE